MNRQAPLIVFEGIDGAGTTTQAELLVEALRGAEKNPVHTHEPSDGPIGTMIRQMLSRRIVLPERDGVSESITRETLALLFAADRMDHVAATISPALDAGNAVVSDRYFHSSLVYQGDVEEGTDGSEQVDYAWVWSLNSRALIPDITFFLEIDVATSMKRISGRHSHDFYETHDKLKRLVRRYDEVMDVLADFGQHIVRIDGKLSVEEIHHVVWLEVDRFYSRLGG